MEGVGALLDDSKNGCEGDYIPPFPFKILSFIQTSLPSLQSLNVSDF